VDFIPTHNYVHVFEAWPQEWITKLEHLYLLEFHINILQDIASVYFIVVKLSFTIFLLKLRSTDILRFVEEVLIGKSCSMFVYAYLIFKI
jgi:hypothetical protein